MVALTEPVRRVVGDKTASVLAEKFGIRTVGELIRHYPRRYFERGELADLANLRADEEVTIQAQVVSVKGRRIRPKLHKTDVVVTDGRSRLLVTFFNQSFRDRQLEPGMTVLFAGKVERFNRALQLTNPEVQLGDDADAFAGALLPIYPASGKLVSWRLAKAVHTALDVAEVGPDPLPEEIRARHGLLGLREALEGIHRPADFAELARARTRLKWDEALILQVTLAQRRVAARGVPAIPRPTRADGLLAAFDARLPFALTAGQQSVCAEIFGDLAQPHPMYRLLQGEVGSGKTVVALRAMLAVIDAGGQAALLAPTEVLAQQHARSLQELLGPLAAAGQLGGADVATRVALLTGSQPTAVRREALLDAASGKAGIVVGTHALLEENVQFAELGLVVVDEQHRFGVEQRDALRAKGQQPPHVLVMTATPIPRTVAMTVFGDLEVSTLTEMPTGRSPIATHVVPVAEKPGFLARAWQRLTEEVEAGHQAYVVCPRIGADGEGGINSADSAEEEPTGDEPDDADQPDPERRPPLAVLEVAPMLADGPLAGLRLEVLHGRLAPEVKDGVMRRFTGGQVDVLVATTVIEVGVDVPNATTMVVMDADRFGVSQLHQLRGRVGRGSAAGLCLLVTDATPGTKARERLDAVASTLDGFALSRVDLEQRREGDVLSAKQSGRPTLRLLRVLRDEELIVAARAEAIRLVDADPTLADHPALAAAIAAAVDEASAEYLDKA